MAHQRRAKIIGADDRPSGRQPGNLVSDPGLSVNVNQFGGGVGQALESLGNTGVEIAARFVKADKASALAKAKGEFNSDIVASETRFIDDTNHSTFLSRNGEALKASAARISGGLSGSTKAAFDLHVTSAGAASTARVTADTRKLMVGQSVAGLNERTVTDLGLALTQGPEGQQDAVRAKDFEIDQLADARIIDAKDAAKRKLDFRDDLAEGNLQQIINEDPFNPAAEAAIKNLRPELQPKAVERLERARNARVARDNREDTQVRLSEERAEDTRNVEARVNIRNLMPRDEQADPDSRARNIERAKIFLDQKRATAIQDGLTSQTLDDLQKAIVSYEAGNPSRPGQLNIVLNAIDDRSLTRRDDPRITGPGNLSYNDQIRATQALADLNRQGRLHYSSQAIYTSTRADVAARITANDPVAASVSQVDKPLALELRKVRSILGQSILTESALQAREQGIMPADLGRPREGEYNVQDDAERIIGLVLSQDTTDARILELTEEKGRLLQSLKGMFDAEASIQAIEAAAPGQPVIVPAKTAADIAKENKIKSRIAFIDRQNARLMDLKATFSQTGGAGREDN